LLNLDRNPYAGVSKSRNQGKAVVIWVFSVKKHLLCGGFEPLKRAKLSLSSSFLVRLRLQIEGPR
jgi:hypothetical protein